MASIAYKKGTNAEVNYFFARNLHGDVIAVYRSSDSKLIGTYEYDLWGRPISIKEASTGIDTDGILTKNPIRYRSYYYDNETGFYNLNLRYYDPEIRRFISADSMDLLTVATLSPNCKNLFNYCENNPVNGKDSTGAYIETPLDLITLGISVVDVCMNPTDGWAWLGLGLDVVDLLIPAGGLGEVYKSGRMMKKANQANDLVNTADTIGDTAKATKGLDNVIESGTPSGFYQDVNGRWHRPNGQFASNAEVGITSPAKVSTGSHGNSLSDPRTNYGYVLVDRNTNEILKFGETIHPTTRYSKSYLDANNANMMILEQGNKLDIHLWQHDMNEYYFYKYNEYPPLNSGGW